MKAAVTITTSPQPAERELIIDMRPDEWVQYEGTSAQLQAEGLIPEGFEWPRARDDKRWEANGFKYWLRRTRPEGYKGPMRSWYVADNWFVRVEVTDRDWEWRNRRVIERKAEALRDEIHRQSPAGRRERDENFRRILAACTDKAFRAFMSKALPERKRPGRKPKPQGPGLSLDSQ